MTVAIVDYGSGNLRSAQKAFERVAQEAGYAGPILVTSDPDAVAAADRVVLPGVGAFADCRAGLYGVTGMVDAMTMAVRDKGRPFLGICVGMQLMATRGVEYGVHAGLDWIAGEVARLEPSDPTLKVPHMGWNDLRIEAPDHPVLKRIANGAHAYFVHSFHFRPERAGDVLATCDYGGAIAAAIGRDNMIGTQFHPEKSQRTGLELIRGFLAWRP